MDVKMAHDFELTGREADLLERIERLLAAMMFPRNPHMSGDQRNWLSSNQRRLVEDTALEIILLLRGQDV